MPLQQDDLTKLSSVNYENLADFIECFYGSRESFITISYVQVILFKCLT